MTASNVIDLCAARKAALAREARSRGLSGAETARLVTDEGAARAEADRARAAWMDDARAGLALEADRQAAGDL